MAYYLTKDELYHHGIKGQKWGIRRFQNPDGTYTEEGLRRRRNKSNDLTRNIYTRSERKRKQIFETNHVKFPNRKIEEAFVKPYSSTLSVIEDHERAKKNADLGLKALSNLGMLNYKDDGDTNFNDNDRFWFMAEDQTIGLGAVADLINRGYTPKDVIKTIDFAHELTKKNNYELMDKTFKKDDALTHAVFELDYLYSSDWNTDYMKSVKEYIDECHKIYKKDFIEKLGARKIK